MRLRCSYKKRRSTASAKMQLPEGEKNACQRATSTMRPRDVDRKFHLEDDEIKVRHESNRPPVVTSFHRMNKQRPSEGTSHQEVIQQVNTAPRNVQVWVASQVPNLLGAVEEVEGEHGDEDVRHLIAMGI